MYVKLSQLFIHRDDFVVLLLCLTADNPSGEAGPDAQDPFLLWWVHPWHEDGSGDTAGTALTCCCVTAWWGCAMPGNSLCWLCNPTTQGAQHRTFRLSLAKHRRNTTLGFLRFLWIFGSICHPPWGKVKALLVFNILGEKIMRGLLFGFLVAVCCFWLFEFNLRMQTPRWN